VVVREDEGFAKRLSEKTKRESSRECVCVDGEGRKGEKGEEGRKS
jgi:hypothetical protein